MQKYVLIISQYYHSHNMTICEVPKDFEEKARILIEELEKYKRNPECNSKIHYGDFEDCKSLGLFRKRNFDSKYGRLNVNDISGDIYFILSNSMQRLIEDIVEYSEKQWGASKQSNKKIRESIDRHHDKFKLKEIIEKHFEPIK